MTKKKPKIKKGEFRWRPHGRDHRTKHLRAVLEVGPGSTYDLGDPVDAALFARVAVKYSRAINAKTAGKRPGAPKKLTALDRQLEANILRDARDAIKSKALGRGPAIMRAQDRFLVEGNRKLRLKTIDRMLDKALPK